MEGTTMSRTRSQASAARRSVGALPARAARRLEQGDVPGWVLITLMTAALVAALWAVAEDQLVALFKSALASVGN
jgi:hypothetical protein